MRLAITLVVCVTTTARADDPPGELAPAAEATPPTAARALDATEPSVLPHPIIAETRPPDAFLVGAIPRLRIDLELFTSARWTRRAGSDLTEIRVDRGEVGAQLGLGDHAAASLHVESIRSASEGGALGIDGNSLVLRIKRAQVLGGGDVGPLHLDGAFGVVADPWIGTLDDGYTVRPLSPSASERLLGWSTADLAIRGRAAIGPARLTVSVGNGEGLRYPERNTGKTTTAVVELVAIHQATARLSFAAVGRDGSIGPALIREHRAGGGFSFASASVRSGGEVVRAWGVGDRGDLVATVAGGWLEARVADHVFVGGRGATITYSAGRSSTFGGAVAVEPWQDRDGRLRLWLAVDRVTSSGAGAPLPGSDPGSSTTLMLLASAVASRVIP